MSKSVTLSDEAYEALHTQRQNKKESLSDVILRLVPRPIRTFGDLEMHLENFKGSVVVDFEALGRVRRPKTKRQRAD
jgi:predicted CopG family antitoxin